MRPLEGELLLEAWERGCAETAVRRPVALLAAGCEQPDCETLAGLSLVERDLELFRLRRLTFGDTLRGVVPCASCSTRLEFEISIASILDRLGRLPHLGDVRWSAKDVSFAMRPVTTRDLAEIASSPDPRRRLLALCTSVEGADTRAAIAAHEQAIVDRFNELNENAETRFTITCTLCGESDQVDLDIGRFLWADIRNAAFRMMREVRDLAGAYGWSERDILSMSPARRACYMDMARA